MVLCIACARACVPYRCHLRGIRTCTLLVWLTDICPGLLGACILELCASVEKEKRGDKSKRKNDFFRLFGFVCSFDNRMH